MRYLALACDFDGTLALNGRVTESTLTALRKVLASGRKLLLVTGRQLSDLDSVFPHFDLFEWVIAENGGVLYRPKDKTEKLLHGGPSQDFIIALRRRGVEPLFVGRVIVAAWKPHETAILETIRDMGLELQVIFNKEAVMVLPAGLNKASGLKAALKELGLSFHNVVGIGDAENDHAFMSACECSIAVANALPTIKEKADVVTKESQGDGVVEIIHQILADDLSQYDSCLQRHHILIGNSNAGQVRMPPYGTNLLLAGSSGSGKTTLATGLLERLMDQGYQVCILDPEGDYGTLEGTVILGNRQRVPEVDEVLQLLQNSETHVVINLLGIPWDERPPFFQKLFPRLQEMRARTGRPHWLAVDEAHHLLPSSWKPAALTLPLESRGIIFITVHPNEVARAALELIDSVVAVGENPLTTVREFSESIKRGLPKLKSLTLEAEQALFWGGDPKRPPVRVSVPRGRTQRLRHQRKYVEGELSQEKSFYFRGPDNKLNLRAHNLVQFLRIAEGVDEVTWMHHLRRGHYSGWFREMIKDETLASEAARVESFEGISALESRKLIQAAIEHQYTLPAETSKLIPGHGAPTQSKS